MILVKLKLSGFLSYREPVEIDFSTFDIACISGANGAGKSSLLDAITWALFGQARRRDDALIHSLAKEAQVTLEFDYEGSLYRVIRKKEREKTAILEFYIHSEEDKWRPLTEHSLRETEERIRQTLRLDYETFINASFFLQGQADNFAQQKPADRKKILSNILGLEVWETYKEEANNRRRNVETEIKNKDFQLGEIEIELNEEAERREKLAEAVSNHQQAVERRAMQESALDNLRRLASSLERQQSLVALLFEQYQGALTNRTQLEDNLAERLEQQQKLHDQLDKAEAIETAYQDWLAEKASLEVFDKLAASFRETQSRRNQPLMVIENEKSGLQTEFRSLQQQESRIQEGASQIPVIETQLQEIAQKQDSITKQLDALEGLEGKLQELKETRARRDAENKRLHEDAEQLKKRIKSLENTEGANCPLCGQPLGTEDRQNLVLTLNEELVTSRKVYGENLEFFKTYEAQRSELESDINRLKELHKEAQQMALSTSQLEERKKQLKSSQLEWQNNGGKRMFELQGLLESESFALDARHELAQIDAELVSYGYDPAAHEQCRQTELAGRDSQEQRNQLQKAGAILETLEGEITRLRRQLDDQRNKTEELYRKYLEADDSYKKDSASMPDLDQQEAELRNLREQENQLQMLVIRSEQLVNVLDTLRSKKVEYSAQREVLASTVDRLKMLEKAFGKDGVPALLIERALPEIESHSNDVLDRLSSGSLSVHFETQRDYKDKNRADKRETLDILIRDISGKQREYEMFSGGEMFRVNFAIRLALSRVLARRAGSRMQTLVIDEGFGSQDQSGRQKLVEAINEVRSDFAKVLVITHMEELKDAFPARIEVEKTLEGSRVKVMV